MIEDMLALAAEPAAARSAAGRPRAVHLRRATLTAYYALFHALARLCAERLVGWNKPWGVVTPIYRSLEHRRARDVFNALCRETRDPPLDQIAAAFVTLQNARHDADYNPEPYRLNRSGTIELIGAAGQAVELLNSLTPDEKLVLAVRLIARPR